MFEIFTVGTALVFPDRIGSFPNGLLFLSLPSARADGGYDRLLGLRGRGRRCRRRFSHYSVHELPFPEANYRASVCLTLLKYFLILAVAFLPLSAASEKPINQPVRL